MIPNLKLKSFCKLYNTSYGDVLVLKHHDKNKDIWEISIQMVFVSIQGDFNVPWAVTLPFSTEEKQNEVYYNMTPEHIEKIVEVQFQSNSENPFPQINLN